MHVLRRPALCLPEPKIQTLTLSARVSPPSPYSWQGDLKAGNVLLQHSVHGSYGQVAKISDFGLSAVLLNGSTHRSTASLGTITHMVRGGTVSLLVVCRWWLVAAAAAGAVVVCCMLVAFEYSSVISRNTPNVTLAWSASWAGRLAG